MMATRWIVHCETCGYLSRPEYPGDWMPDRRDSYRFRHKREALRAIAEYSLNARERLFVESVHAEKDAIFD